jgi:acyl carrier protein
MQTNTIENEIIDFIKTTFRVNEEIQPELSLVGTGIVSSISMIELVCWIEQNFELQIPPEDFLPENFDAVKNICNYISNKKAS